MSSAAPIPTRPPPPSRAELALMDASHSTHRLSRRSLCVDGVGYRLLLAAPTATPPAEGFPVLYLLDGNAAFDLMSAGQLASADGVILIGVAHDADLRFDPPSRSRDYTPAAGGQGLHADPNRPDRLVGGADIFLQRLAGPIRDAAEEGLCVDASNRMIFGHSLAGMFALYALLTRPDAFKRAAAASPSIWWGDEFLLRLEERTPLFASRHEVLVTLGDSERRSSSSGPHWDGPAPHTLEMIRRLEAREGMNVSHRIFEGLGHAATLPASLPLVLEFARQLPATFKEISPP